MKEIMADISFGFKRDLAAIRRGLDTAAAWASPRIDYATEWLNYRMQHKPYGGRHRATRKMEAMATHQRVALRWNKTPLAV